MIRGLWFFARLALLIVAAVYLAERPGAASIEWQGWLVETSASLLFAVVVALIFVVMQLFRVIRIFRRAPQNVARARRRQQRQSAGRALTKGLVAIAAGEESSARKYAQRAMTGLGVSDPALAHFLAGQAAHVAGELDQAEQHFAALRISPETQFLGLRGLIAIALERGDDVMALAMAREARRVKPSSIWAAKMLFELEVRAGMWAEAELTLLDAAQLKAFAPLVAKRHQVAVLLARSDQAGIEGRGADANSYAQKAHDLDPASAPAARRLARLLDGSGRLKPAERAIERTWVLSPHPSLAQAWSELGGASDPITRVQRLEHLVELAPGDPTGRQALGEAQEAAGLWADARNNLQRAAEAGMTRRLAQSMARVEEGAGSDAAVVRSLLMKAIDAPDDPSWVCATCGTQHRRWAPSCPSCHAFDSMGWGARPPAPPAPVSADPVGDALLLRSA